jgi:hypothetical protein
MTVIEALERSCLLKARTNLHLMTAFRTMLVPTRDGRLAFCERCWDAAWTITSVSPPVAGGLALQRECMNAESATKATHPATEEDRAGARR